MAISAATSSQNNRSGSGRYVPLRKKGGSESAQTNPFKSTDLVQTLNAIDHRNIRTMFKQAKDPVELAFDHINSQSLQKITKDAIKEGINDMRGGIEDFKDAMVDIKESLGDFVEFVSKIFTPDAEFTPEEV